MEILLNVHLLFSVYLIGYILRWLWLRSRSGSVLLDLGRSDCYPSMSQMQHRDSGATRLHGEWRNQETLAERW